MVRRLLVRRRLLRPLLVTLSVRALLLRLRLPLAHLLASCAHLLVILVLLVARENAHELLVQLAIGVAIARASFGMRLCVLMDERLNALLLIVGEVEVAQSLRPAVLHSCFTGGTTIGARRRRLALLGADAKRHRERCGKHARRQKVDLHRGDFSRFA